MKKKKSAGKKRNSKNSFNRNLIIGVVVLAVVFLLLVNFTGYSEEEGLANTQDYYSFDLFDDVSFEDEFEGDDIFGEEFAFLNDEDPECVEEGFGILPGVESCCEGLEPNNVFICYPPEGDGACDPSCLEGEVCIGGTCFASDGSCSDDSDCGEGESCCGEDDPCEPGYCHVPVLKIIGESCSGSNLECESGHCGIYPAQPVAINVPVTYACKGCGSNAECSARGTGTPFCGQDHLDCVECKYTSDCTGGQICDNGEGSTGSCMPFTCVTTQDCLDVYLFGTTCNSIGSCVQCSVNFIILLTILYLY